MTRLAEKRKGNTGAARFHRAMAVLTGAGILYGLAGDPVRTGQSLVLLPLLACLLLPLAWALHDLKWFRCSEAISVVFWACAVDWIFGPLIEIAGRSRFPLVDHTLSRIDAVLFQTQFVVMWMRKHPALHHVSELVYASLLPLLAAALILPIVRGSRSAHRLLLAAVLSICITTLGFHFLPAAGPWTVQGYEPTRDQAITSEDVLALKSHPNGLPTALRTTGLVSFPSFHTILAMLCAFALWPIPYVRWAGLVLATGIVISTVTTGWHYGIDVIAGIAVALFCEGAARRIYAAIERGKRPVTVA